MLPGNQIEESLQQTQVLSLSQQQSLAMLSMPIQKLREYLSAQLRDYPLLDIQSETAESLSELYQTADAQKTVPDDDSYPEATPGPRVPHKDGLWHAARSGCTLREDLIFQLSALKLPFDLYDCCVYIICSLTPQGYLAESEEEISLDTGIPVSDVRQAIYVIQSLQPTGVAAHDLSECLLLQLVESRQFNKYTVKIVKEHLESLACGRYGKIGAALNLSTREAEHWCGVIRSLNPIPSKGYPSDEYTRYIVPEAIISQDACIRMNNDAVPRITLDPEYKKLKELSGDRTVKKFLYKTEQKAKILQGQLCRRQDTLSQIIEYIVSRQKAYFCGDKNALEAMTMQQVASALSLHVSTVSRAVSSKYVETVYGPVSLRSLFTASIKVAGAVSAGSIKARIKEYVRRENPAHPFSDEELRSMLEAQHIHLSRRTVAKYRAELGILPFSMRRSRE